MKDEYTTAFYDIVKESQKTSGFDLPHEIEAYVVMLLASKIDSPNFLPTSSFAEEFLKLKRPYKYNAKDLGDTCLFVTGVFPSYGISVRYYSDIGISSYSIVQEDLNAELFGLLSSKFDFIRDFIDLTINNNHNRFNAFR